MALENCPRECTGARGFAENDAEALFSGTSEAYSQSSGGTAEKKGVGAISVAEGEGDEDTICYADAP